VLVSGPEGRRISFHRSTVGKALSLPCGRCIGCRLERSRQWSVRIMHEAKMHLENSFVTLTYSPEFFPKDGSLSVDHCQLFLKRLRSRLSPLKIRFFLCGEYGETFGRPHYHAIIFGYAFPDKVPLFGSVGSTGKFQLFDSELLSDTWGFGQVRIGEVSSDSASYVANYATKKIIGSPEVVNAHYRGRTPEFLLMSRRPGIGRSWYDSFSTDVFPSDEVIVKGLQARPPRYYSSLLESQDPEAYEAIRSKREAYAQELESFVLGSGVTVNVSAGSNDRRLVVREQVARAKAALKSRRVE